MNFIDLIVIIVTSFFLLRGLFRGFILELTIVIGLIAGYLISITYYDYLSVFCYVLLVSFFVFIPGFLVGGYWYIVV